MKITQNSKTPKNLLKNKRNFFKKCYKMKKRYSLNKKISKIKMNKVLKIIQIYNSKLMYKMRINMKRNLMGNYSNQMKEGMKGIVTLTSQSQIWFKIKIKMSLNQFQAQFPSALPYQRIQKTLTRMKNLMHKSKICQSKTKQIKSTQMKKCIHLSRHL